VNLLQLGKQKSVLPHSPPVSPLWRGLPAHLIALIAAFNLPVPCPSLPLFSEKLAATAPFIKTKVSHIRIYVMFRVSTTKVRNHPIVYVPMVPLNDVFCYADTILKKKMT
jgi:hypothetical protein